MHIQPYLFFDGRAEEALAFYGRVLGAQILMLMRFRDMPPSDDPSMRPPPPGSADKIMHACFRIGETEVMASDGHCQGKPSFQGVALSLSVADPGEAQRTFAALAEGGEVRMALGKTFFSPAFGMVADRFGVTWMIVVPTSP